MSDYRPSRRSAVVGAATAAMIVPRHVLGGSGYQAPSTRADCRRRSGWNGPPVSDGCSDEAIVALCDVDHASAAMVFRKYPSARTYKDWRVLFEREGEFDAVIIATADHNHALRQRQTMDVQRSGGGRPWRLTTEWRVSEGERSAVHTDGRRDALQLSRQQQLRRCHRTDAVPWRAGQRSAVV